MTAPENNPQAGLPAPDPDAINQDLSRLVNILFAGLILTSFTLTAYLGLQMKRATEEVAQAKAMSDELARAIHQQDADVQSAYTKLEEFARKHPDFQNQVMYKYKINVSTPAK